MNTETVMPTESEIQNQPEPTISFEFQGELRNRATPKNVFMSIEDSDVKISSYHSPIEIRDMNPDDLVEMESTIPSDNGIPAYFSRYYAPHQNIISVRRMDFIGAESKMPIKLSINFNQQAIDYGGENDTDTVHMMTQHSSLHPGDQRVIMSEYQARNKISKLPSGFQIPKEEKYIAIKWDLDSAKCMHTNLFSYSNIDKCLEDLDYYQYTDQGCVYSSNHNALSMLDKKSSPVMREELQLDFPILANECTGKPGEFDFLKVQITKFKDPELENCFRVNVYRITDNKITHKSTDFYGILTAVRYVSEVSKKYDNTLYDFDNINNYISTVVYKKELFDVNARILPEAFYQGEAYFYDYENKKWVNSGEWKKNINYRRKISKKKEKKTESQLLGEKVKKAIQENPEKVNDILDFLSSL